jgi:hypothetical protein
MKCEDLEIWKIANELVLQIHQLTINNIPNLKCLRLAVRSEVNKISEGQHC